MFSFFLALKYLKPKRSVTSVVTILSVFGVMLGVAIVIIVRAVFTGFGDAWQEKLLSFKPHFVVQSAHNGTIRNEEEICQKIEREIPGVIAVSPSIETRVLVEFNRKILAPVILGADANRIQKMLPAMSMAGGEFNLNGDTVVIGLDMAADLGCSVGDELLVYSPMNLINKDEIYFPERLRISGIYNTGRHDFDGDFLFVSLPISRDLRGMSEGGATSLGIRIDEPQNETKFRQIRDKLRMILPPHRFAVHTWQEMDIQMFNAIATEKNMMMLLLMFISIVAIFCVVNTLIVITVQKTNEIGLLKALGFSTRQLMMTFVLYGWIQCIVGTVLGIGAAFLVLENLQGIINGLAVLGMEVFPKDVYGLDSLPWRVTSGEIFTISGVVVFLCVAASFLPAWRAATMDPVTALRKE